MIFQLKPEKQEEVAVATSPCIAYNNAHTPLDYSVLRGQGFWEST
jgi:hypothetical protein